MSQHQSGDPAEPPQDLPAAEAPPAPDEWATDASVPARAAAEAVADAEDRFLRLAAEFDNYRKRTMREKTETFDRGATAIVTQLLDVLDDIDRLAASSAAGASAEGLHHAFELIQRKLHKELEAAGLQSINPVGAPFDPTQHEAVAVVAPETAAQDHTVKATFQAGYRFKGAVVRPARVQVYSSHGTA